MELYILDKNTLDILYVCKPTNYEINLDEETNAKTCFTVVKHESLIAGNYIVVNGLYRQFLFIISEDGISTEKGSNLMEVTALDISNLFDQKIIEKNTNIMSENSIEEFIARTINENFVNSDDTLININYIDIYYNTATKGTVATNSENGLYNLHTFITNCRQNKNICTDFKFINGRLRIDITNKNESQRLIDTTLSEVVDYNKVYEADITAKVQVLIREDNSIYNLYLKADRTTTENKNDPERVKGRIETISVDLAENARQEALNVFKGNSYKHLVEFKIAKTSQLMDVTQLYIGREIKIKTEDDIYDSYISAITIKDENFVYFKSGNLRVDLLGKLKKETDSIGNKLDVTGGVIRGKLNIIGELEVNKKKIIELNEVFFESGETYSFERYYTGGFVTTGKTDILFSIPMPKRLDNVIPILTAGKITIRDVNGNYLKTTDNINNASITIYKEKGWISLLLRYSSALSTTNNTPVSIYIQDVSIRFN